MARSPQFRADHVVACYVLRNRDKLLDNFDVAN